MFTIVSVNWRVFVLCASKQKRSFDTQLIVDERNHVYRMFFYCIYRQNFTESIQLNHQKIRATDKMIDKIAEQMVFVNVVRTEVRPNPLLEIVNKCDACIQKQNGSISSKETSRLHTAETIQ